MDIEQNKNQDVCPSKRNKLELSEVKEKLSKAKGPQYWRTLDELAETPEFEEMLHREFPRQASEWVGDGTSRRTFMKIMGASLALGGMTACTKQPLESIVPYVHQPSEITLGKPLFFASAMPFPTGAIPVLVESHEGRPTKVEGNPQHPATLGGSDAYSQASPLTMYDPDRSQYCAYLGEARTYGQFLDDIRVKLTEQQAKGGAGLRLLTGAVISPTLGAQIKSLQSKFPQMKWYQWEPVQRDAAMKAAIATFGQPVETQINFEKARVVLTLDADFLTVGYPGFHRNARGFAKQRHPELKDAMIRFYAVESTPTNTGGKADHRLPMRASEIEGFARALAGQLGVAGGGGQVKPEQQKFLAALAGDLQKNRGASVILAGDHQPEAVHMLAHAMNQALGNFGQSITVTDSVEVSPAIKQDQLRELVGEMNAGKVELLVMSNVNPIYDAPGDVDFYSAMMKVPYRVHHGLYQDETAQFCQWHVNATHYLEQWGDARAVDGTISIIQPLIAPLYNGRSEYELLGVLNGEPQITGYEIAYRYWQSQHQGADFEQWWKRSLHDGFIANSAFPARNVAGRAASIPAAAQNNTGDMEIMFRRDPTIYDGRFSNNGWLQELPKPMIQITWGNPVLMSLATGKKLGIKSEDVIEFVRDGRKQTGAVWLQPGHPDNSMTVYLGYGRERAGNVGSGLGFNAYKLLSAAQPWFGPATLRKTGDTFGFAYTQGHQNMEGRALVRAATLEDFLKDPGFAHEMVEAPPPGLTLYEPYKYTEAKWGMAIDLNSCIGCKTCVVACQAENNIPVVGKLEVKRGRHMHWLRVDNYHEGTPENPKTYYQPVPCMQCETAPCEVVCPVGATVHSSEGLNDMVYNRCVGTRYCSNNCPYKVRRFNFLLYQNWDTPQLKFVRNPEVTVRSRGVMEKCTYCVQRITNARIDAEEAGLGPYPKDGSVLTACQQACPADAIVFGDMNDPNSRVSKIKASQRNYGLLEELNTRPRTTYLAAVTNPNPELISGEEA